YRRSTHVVEVSGESPATHQVLHEGAAMVQDLLPRSNREFINLTDAQHMCAVVSGDGPLVLGIELIQTPNVRARYGAIGIREGFRQSVSHQHGQAVPSALLKADLESVILVRAGRIEWVPDVAELRIWS